MGEMAEHLDDSYDFSDEMREMDRQQFNDRRAAMVRRFYENSRAEVGATIECAACGRKVVKRSYQQKFCPPVVKGKRKTYPCKDLYHNVTNPRGKFAHLREDHYYPQT